MRSPFLLQAKQAQFPQPFHLGEVLQPSDHLSGSPLDSFQELWVFLLLGAPGLDTVLHVGEKCPSGSEGYKPSLCYPP